MKILEKNTLFYLLLCIPFLLQASVPGKELNPFNYISVYGNISVDMIPGETNKVEIRSIDSGIDLNDFEAEVKEGILYIRTKVSFTKDIPIRISLIYAEPIFEVRSANGAKIFTQTPLVTDIIKLSALNGGNMDIEIEASEIEADVVAGSLIMIKGSVRSQEVTARGGGVYDALELTSEKTILSVVRNGLAKVNTTKELTGKVSTGGYTVITGSPEMQTLKTRLGGEAEYQ
jgi:hypothetical protein